MKNNLKAQIIQLHSNLAVVNSDDDKNFVCKIKGILKFNQLTKPVVGDFVEYEIINDEPIINKILTRKNYLIRPKVANVDTIILVQSLVQPNFNFHLLMTFLAYYEVFVDEVIIVLTKIDLIENKDYEKLKIYFDALISNGYKIFFLPEKNEFKKLENLLENKTFALAGNSGVGKSTLTNQLIPNLNLKTQEISLFLNRGKHTTTSSQLIKTSKFNLVDTPGFSSIDINLLTKLDFAHSYHDFKKYSLNCKYSNCLHVNEPNCKIKECVSSNKISLLRYNEYLNILKDIKK